MMLASLIDLAKESSSEKRRELMGHMTALFVAGAERYTDEEKALFNGVLKRLVDMVEDGDKEALSEELSTIPQTPRDLVVKLADEGIEIARYMLQYSDVLTDADLMHFAKTKSQQHLLAISKRNQLQSRLTDVLLERGEQPVRLSVASNPGAELSDWGARLLVKMAQSDDMIRDSMMARPDITKETFNKLIDQLPPEHAKKLRHLYENNEALVESLFHQASETVIASKLDRKKSRINTKVDIRDIRSGKRDLNRIFSEYCLSSNLLDLSYLLADIGELDQKYVLNVIVRPEISGIAILCRALEVGETEFSNFCKARCSLLKMPTSVAENWLSEYRVLSVADSQRVLRFIKVRLKAMEHEEALREAS